MIENSKEGYYLALRQTQSTLNSQHTGLAAMAVFFFGRCISRNVVLPPRSSVSNPLSR